MVNRQRLVKEFLSLTKIEGPSRNERTIAEAIMERLKELKLNYIEDRAGEKIGGNVGNIICYLKGKVPQAPSILFVVHMDTVVPCKGVKPKVQEGIIYSDGTTILGADDRAAVSSLLEALTILKENKIPSGDVEVVFTVAEEVGLLGAKNLEVRRLKSKLGFVLDSGTPSGSIIVQTPSAKSVEVTCIGRSAHAGVEPEKGINAIQMAGLALSLMRLGRVDKETTSNIGLISGGKATNVVPDLVELKGEARSFSDLKLERQVLHMEDCFRKAAAKMKGKVKFKAKDEYYTFRLTPKDAVVKMASAAIRKLGLEPNLTRSGGGSDANILNERGVPSVNLGLGYKGVHTTNESIAIDSLVTTTNIILSIIKEAAAV